MGRFIDIAASVICIGAGLYLLSTESAADNSIFNPLLHGIGAYFVAKGLFVARSTHLAAESRTLLGRLTEFAALRHDRETGRHEAGEPETP